MKPLDIQAAIGRAQMTKLPSFIEARKKNWNYLRENLDQFSEFFDFSLPTHATSWSKDGFKWDKTGCRTECSWFGFMIRIKKTAPFNSSSLASFLDSQKVGNRMLFGESSTSTCNVTAQKDNPSAFRVVGTSNGADKLMKQALFLGTYPGLTKAMLDYEIEQIKAFCDKY